MAPRKAAAARLDPVDGASRAEQLAHQIKSLIGMSAQVRVVHVGGIERSLGKAKRGVDKRPNE